MPVTEPRRSPLRVLLVGEESAGIQLLRALARRDDHIVGVMASPARAEQGTASLWAVARQMGYTTWPAAQVRNPDFAEVLRSERTDVILNVHSLHIIHPSLLNTPRIGSFNMHPGPLPKYAGLNTVSWAIRRSESRFGVTVHEMTPVVDAGRIAYEAQFPVQQNDTPVSLSMKCVQAGIPLVLQLLDTAAKDPSAIPLSPQDLSRRQYFGHEVPDGGRLCWDRPARQVVNFVRACDYHPFPSPWGHPRARLGNQEFEVLKAYTTGLRSHSAPGTVGSLRATDATVACADSWIVLHRLRIGGCTVAPGSVLRPGDRLKSGLEDPGSRTFTEQEARCMAHAS